MLSVLLKILAVIGIILLALLGILLFLLLMVLFVPITYRITGQIDEHHKETTVKANGLLGILRFTLTYSEKVSWKLKFLWFDLTDVVKKNPAISVEKSDDKGVCGTIPEPTSEQTSVKTPEQASDKTNNLIEKIQSIFVKIKDIWDNITHYIEILQEEDTKTLIAHCFHVSGGLLKHIRPGKMKVNAVIGFDSPDITGKIYGFLCMLYPYYGNDIHIIPDFENKILEVDLFIRGRIYICTLLWHGLRILLHKKLFKVIHKFKNGGKHKNGR